MIKLSNILQEDRIKRRSKVIRNKKFNSLLTKFYDDKKDIIQSNTTPIYRGIEYNDAYIFIQPSKHTRKSKDIANYYTLIIDNSKYWKEYPKRSKSIICTTRDGRAKNYGRFLYQVYPKIGAKIGVCPKYDVWFSFTKGLELINKMFEKTYKVESILILSYFNSFLARYFGIDSTDSYETIVNKINEYQLNNKQKAMLKKYKCNTLFDFIDYCLNPDLNGFQLVTFDENFNVNDNNEVWTDADSLLENITE